MGKSGSKSKDDATSRKSAEQSRLLAQKKATIANDKRRKAELDPNDFIISSKTAETLIRESGSINGEQFNIETCKDCDIFLLDHMDSSFVDDCENCRIFIGPARSSVFVRNCKNCAFVIACRQLRTRNCEACQFALFCTTEPVIEESVAMEFACFDFAYFSLREHIAEAGLKLWNNKWWQVYDFNKKGPEELSNWSLLPQSRATSLLHVDKCSVLSREELTMNRVVPITLGSRPRPHQETCFVIFLPQQQVDVLLEAFLARVEKTEAWVLCRVRSMVLNSDKAKNLFAWSKESTSLAQRCQKQDGCNAPEWTGVELCGDGINLQVQEAFENTGLALGFRNIRIVPREHREVLAKAFFEVWKDEI